MKKILTLVALLVSLSVYGQSFQYYTWSTNTAVAITNAIIPTNCQVSEITVAAPSANGASVTFTLWDSAISNWVTRVAYTNRVGYSTTIVDTVIFTNGPTMFMTNYYTNTGWRWVNKTVAASSANYPEVYSVTLAAGEMVTVPVDLTFARGITYRTTTNIVATIKYREINQ